MTTDNLSVRYRDYIDCLNKQDWLSLEKFAADEMHYNGDPVGLSGYRAMLEGNYRDIPDLRFVIALLVCEPPHVSTRLIFDCTPSANFLGLAVNGRKVSFTEKYLLNPVGARIGLRVSCGQPDRH